MKPPGRGENPTTRRVDSLKERRRYRQLSESRQKAKQAALAPFDPARKPESIVEQDTRRGGGLTGRARRAVSGKIADATWNGRTATAGTILGCTVAAVSTMVAVGYGFPVLGHGWSKGPVVFGIIGVVLGVTIVLRGWPHAGRKIRRIVAVSAAVIAVAFSVGAFSNPVVINGTVYLNTSDRAQNMRTLQELRADLADIARFDEYLTLGVADASARVEDYPAVYEKLVDISDKYAEDNTSGPFAAARAAVKAVAYNEAQAIQAMYQYLQQPDQKFLDDRDTFRAVAVEAYRKAGQHLKEGAVAAGIPLTPEVHE